LEAKSQQLRQPLLTEFMVNSDALDALMITDKEQWIRQMLPMIVDKEQWIRRKRITPQRADGVP
jgi:hypothetical protein